MSSLVLLSGGLDSLLVMQRESSMGRLGAALFVNYGQPSAVQELSAAVRIAERYRVELHTTACPLQLGQMGAGDGAQVVPARNLVLLSLAVNLADAKGHNVVCFGPNMDDRRDYADCTTGFVVALVHLLATRAEAGPVSRVHIEAPIAHLTKAMVLRELVESSAPMGLAWSCYRPNEQGRPCQVCASCEALNKAARTVFPASVHTV